MHDDNLPPYLYSQYGLRALVCHGSVQGRRGNYSLAEGLDLEALHGSQTPPLENSSVLVPTVAVRGQHLLAGEDGIGTCHETQHLLLLGERRSASGKTDDGSRHHHASRGNGPQSSIEWRRGIVSHGRALDRHKRVNREGFRVRGHRGHGVDETDMILWLLPEPQDATRAHVQSRVPDVLDGLQALVVSPRGDDGGVVLPRGIDVVIIRRKSRLLQLLGLVEIDHAQRDADLHAHAAHAVDHGLDVLEVRLAAAHVAPRGAHAEPRAAVVLRDARGLEHRVHGDHLGGLEPRVVPRRLRAVRAVLGAPAGLDVHERAHLDGGGVVEFPVDVALGLSIYVSMVILEHKVGI